MKVRTLVETTQEVEVDVSLDDVMAEIASLDVPQRRQEAMRLLSMCVAAVKRVPDAIVAQMSDEQRRVVANALREEAERYQPAAVEAQIGSKHDYPACALFRGGKCTCDAGEPRNASSPSSGG